MVAPSDDKPIVSSFFKQTLSSKAGMQGIMKDIKAASVKMSNFLPSAEKSPSAKAPAPTVADSKPSSSKSK